MKPAPSPPDDGRRDGLSSVDEFLQLLARAVRQFHTYPATSPLCAEAVTACHKAFVLGDRDRLAMRVTPSEFIVEGVSVGGAGSIVARELVQRLHTVRVAGLDIDHHATTRHLSHFCTALLRCEALADTKITFAELLAEQGVDTIVPSMARRPEVLDAGAPADAVCELVRHEQRRRESAFAAGPVNHLYPPEKGWVRLDPAARLESVSLVDLALLVDTPAEVATMLLRLTDDDPVGVEERKNALERKFSDVTLLFSSLDPKLARVMFSKLARAVLELEPARRKNLLRRTILPGLLDGRADGAVLRDFPDVDLADSLCLLLELETAAPEMLSAALHRLDLTEERRRSVLPLVDARLHGSDPGKPGEERAIDRLARRLVHVDAASAKDFSEFAAFDLSLDPAAMSALAGARETIGSADLAGVELRFLARLVQLEANPEVSGTFLRRALMRFTALERGSRWHELAHWASHYRQLAVTLQEPRPDVAEAVRESLAAFFAPARAVTLAALYERDADGREVACTLIDAFGEAVVPGLVEMLADTAQQARTAAAFSLLSARAFALAPALARCLDTAPPSAARAIVKVLGLAGPGQEAAIAAQLEHSDEQVVREALRGLAKIGTAHAASLVTRFIQTSSAKRRASAEEALWHFPAERSAVQVRALLGNSEFVAQNPESASRLLARAAHNNTEGLDSVLANLESMRFHIWNPAIVRVALKAREIRSR